MIELAALEPENDFKMALIIIDIIFKVIFVKKKNENSQRNDDLSDRFENSKS